MGLIWSLIRHFQIRSTGKDLSTKSAMLAWVNTQIPDQEIRNFTTDWNDGVALCALVDRIQPGLCPHYATLDGSNQEANCQLGMKLAEEKLGIPKLLEPGDLCHPNVDEISVMTYLSYFCKAANERLMKWIQSKLPDRGIANFKTDWNNGINLACLVDALNPGTFPNCRELDPHNTLENLVQAMRLAEDNLAIKPVIQASQMADPNVDELNVATYLSRFQYAKPVPQPHEVTCSGTGLYKAFVGRSSHFEVDASRAGAGDLKVTIMAVGGGPVTAEVTQSKHHRGGFEVKYVPVAAGKLTIDVKWSGFEIPASPYTVDVLDPSSFSFSGKQITGGQCAKVGKLVVMEAKGLADVSDLYVLIQHPDAHTEVAKITPKGDGQAECSYTPVRIGKDQVFAKVAGADLPGSPFEVKVVDPSQCSVAAKDLPPGKPIMMNQQTTFVITASQQNLVGIIAEVETPTGVQNLSIVPQKDGLNFATFTPGELGKYLVMVTCAGENIRGSPLSLTACDASKCAFLDTLPRYMQVGQPLEMNLSTKGAGPGDLESHSSQSGILGIDVTNAGKKDLYTVKLIPNSVGDATVDVKWNGVVVPPTPHAVFVCDATKCSAYGPGLLSGKGKMGDPFEFTVQVAHSGRGELTVKPKGPKSVYAAEIKKKSDDTYNVKFTTYEVGMHSIEVLWGRHQITHSPYKVQFSKGADAAQFTASGDGLKRAVAMETAQCMLVGPESGLLKNEVLRVTVTGNELESKVVEKSQFDPKCGNAIVCITDNGNGSYSVEYSVPKSGTYSLAIICDENAIPGSPFEVEVLPPADASKCRAFGSAIDKPTALVVGKPLEFKVDSANAGTGQLDLTASDSSSASLPVFLAENKEERIHTIKIDPQTQGKHKVSVLWSNEHIPGSPFSFWVNDPKNIILLDLPDSSSFIGRVGEPFLFRADVSKAGKGTIIASAKHESGKVEGFELKLQPEGIVVMRHTPKEAGKMELLLSCSGVNLLPSPWICDIANPSLFQVTPPKGYGKQKEYVKFVISGLTKKNTKNLVITAIHKKHNATVKVEYGKDGTAVARFTAKQMGEYKVEVRCASKHVDGSPFTVLVANPDGCQVTGDIPAVIPLGQTKVFQVNTIAAGPGELSFSCKTPSGNTSNCVDCQFRVLATSSSSQQVSMKGMNCGKCDFFLKWAGYSIANMPVGVAVVDPATCSFTCPQLKSGLIKQGEKVEVFVDTSKGGGCIPQVVATGPKARYQVELKDKKNGCYTATFSPWQDGEHTLDVCVGGANVEGSPVKYEVVKPVDPSKITVSGPGLKQAIANRRTEVTIFARESKLFERGTLSYQFKPSGAIQEGEQVDTECKDNGNGTYSLAYTPRVAGSLKLTILGEGEPIAGCPFNIHVKPEPNAKKCTISGNALGTDIFHLVNDPVDLTVDTSAAGTGSLAVSGTTPDKSSLRIFTTEDDKHVHCLKFDPTDVGTYDLSVTWEGDHILGSPFAIHVVDPSKCQIEGPLPSCLQIEQSKGFVISTNGAGSDKVVVIPASDVVKATVTEKLPDSYEVTITGSELGETAVEVQYGGHSIPKSPFTVLVCDPGKCVLDLKDIQSRNQNVGVHFHFSVTSQNAGNAKLHVKPEDPKHQYTIDVKDSGDSSWDISCTPWNTGEQRLQVLWGEFTVPGSPVAFTVSDSKQCVISGLPDPQNFVAIIGEPITFTVDYSKAGAGKLTTLAKLLDGSTEELGREDTDGIAAVSCTPRLPGKLELVLQFNEVDILPSPWVSDVPDPSRFQVTPPKGYGKQKEYVKFAITGITEDTQDFSIKAVHPEHNATVKTEPGKDSGTVIARFTAKQTGDYLVEVKLAGQHIDGSPFKAHVANPDGCIITSAIPKEVHIGVTETLSVDVSGAGPGELSCQAEVLSGDVQVEPEISADEGEDGKLNIAITSASTGRCRLTTKWADYVIPSTPFEVNFVDSSKVSWSCPDLEEGRVKQGDVCVIAVDCKEGGQGTLEVKASGDKSSYATEMQDNQDGTFTVSTNPWQIGENSVAILWGGKSIPNTPIVFEVVKAIEAWSITASGEGLHHAIATHPAEIHINAPEPGLVERGMLTVSGSSEGATEEGDPNAPSLDLKDNEDGTYTLTFLASTEGRYQLCINFEGGPIIGSPFTVTVSAAPDATMCKAFGGALEGKGELSVNNPVQFSVDSTDAGSGHITVAATQPNGDQINVYMLEEKKERWVYHLKFDPEAVGHYAVEVNWEGEAIPGSPFDFVVLDPSKCKVSGLPLPASIAHIEDIIQFKVHFQEAGECTPLVSVAAPGESDLLVLEGASVSNSVLSYEYKPTNFGSTTINIEFGGYSVPGSPFRFQVVDPSKFAITALNIRGEYALVCELVSFGVVGKAPGDEKLAAIAHGPSADLTVEVNEKGDGTYVASFVPIEPGAYEVFVECAGSHVSGSPFTVEVADPSKCQILGDVPSIVQVGGTEEFVVKTRGAGAGDLKALMNGLKKHPGMECKVDNQGLDTYTVTLTGKKIEEINTEIQWAGYNISQSPFKVNICDASQCKTFGQALMSKKGRAGEPITFTVVTFRAGKGKLSVKPKGPSAQYNVDIKELKESTYEVTFTPWEIGAHKVDILWGNAHIPKSPVDINVENPMDSNVCNATGEGLKHAIAGQPTTFTVISSEVGLLDKNALKVSVIGVQSHADVVIKDNNNGCYTVQYVAPTAGAYIASVSFYDRQIPGSPFKVNIVPGPDATKCRSYGPALHPTSLHIAGSPLEFYVDTSEGGYGQLRVYVQGPRDYRPKIFLADDGKGVYAIKFDAMKAGKYFVVVAWSENHIPGSPFKIRVHPAADASKVKAYGPGLKDGFLGDTGEYEFVCETWGVCIYKLVDTNTLFCPIHSISLGSIVPTYWYNPPLNVVPGLEITGDY